jgi:hypothetical protein
MAGSIQFYGRDQVIEAFESRGVQAWSIFQGKELLTKGIGDVAFTEFIEMLSKGSTNAIYTVRVYEDIDDAKQIKSNTPNDGGFNFRLNDENQLITASQYGRMGSMGTLLSEVQALRKEVKDLREEEDEEPEEKPHNLGMMGDILAHPAISPVVPLLVNTLVSSILKVPIQSIPAQQSATATNLAGVTTDERALGHTAVDNLLKHHPKIGTLLTKFVRLAEADKNTFNVLMSSFEGMQI